MIFISHMVAFILQKFSYLLFCYGNDLLETSIYSTFINYLLVAVVS